MAVTLGPKLGLLINSDEGETYVDQFRPFLRFIDSMLLGNVINSTTTAPPTTPNNGDAYLLLGAPTGVWQGNANTVAVWSTEITTVGTNTKVPGWEFWAPNQGWLIWDVAGACFRVYTASGWEQLETGGSTILEGADASKPAAGTAGRIYLTTDTGLIYYDTGSAWITVGPSIPSGAANRVLATPDGASGEATLRALVPDDLPVATGSAFGAVKPDGSTITISSGVISSAAGSGLTITQLSITASASGNFSEPHGLGVAPKFAFLNITSADGTPIWWQGTMWDATNLYLVAEASGATAVAIVAH